MSNCRDHTEHLSSYIEGILSTDKTNQIKNHIESCENCFEKYENLKSIMNSIKDLPKAVASANFDNRLKSILNGSEKSNITTSLLDRFAPTQMSSMLLAAASISILALVINTTFLAEKSRPVFSPRLQMPDYKTTIVDPALNSPLKSLSIENLGDGKSIIDSLDVTNGKTYPNQQTLDRFKDQAVQVGSKRNK